MGLSCKSHQPKIPIQNYEDISAKLGTTYNYRLVQALAKELKIIPGMEILDLGCGSGENAWLLSKRTGAAVLGVDRSRPMVKRALDLIPVVQADVADLSLLSGIFDRAYAVNILQLLSDRSSFCHEVFRVLKPGGWFALPITTHLQIKRRFLNRFFPNLAAIDCHRYPSIQMLCSELKIVGFEKIWIRPLDLGWFRVDRTYVERQRTGITSGLLLLDEIERQTGLETLEKAIQHWGVIGRYPMIRWRRTLLVTRKPEKIYSQRSRRK